MSSAVSMNSRTQGLMFAALALLAGTQSALAQPFFCTPIRPGETAAQVAKRITGEARSTRESWFQIVDPASSRFVAKTSYNYVRTGWNACVATALTDAVAPRVSDTATVWSQRVHAAYADLLRLIQSDDSDFELWVVLLALIALATHGADHYLRDREKVLNVMQQFSEDFVREFERPLITPDVSVRPIQSRLRFAPHSARLDILIAPGAGHVYPNLTDHRHNLDYDLKRVLHVLRDQPFVNGRPYMDGTWVVLPFQLKSGITQAGGR
jgi:hypothetical protein